MYRLFSLTVIEHVENINILNRRIIFTEVSTSSKYRDRGCVKDTKTGSNRTKTDHDQLVKSENI